MRGVAIFTCALGCAEQAEPRETERARETEAVSRASSDPVEALALEVRLRDATAGATRELTLSEPARAALARLRERPLATQRWLLAGGRARIETDAGGVTIDEGGMASVDGDPRRRVAARRVVDLFEGGTVRRTGHGLEADGSASEGNLLGRPVRRQTMRVRYRARTGREGATVEARLDVWFASPSSREAALARLAIDLVGLPFLEGDGRLALHRTDAARGLPLRWRITVGGGDAAPALEGEVVAIERARMPARALAVAHGPWAEPAALAGLSGVFAPRDLLARLRVAADPRETPGSLRVRNRTPHALLVLADGFLLARVAPRSDAALDGLPPGYYRVYARTLFGTFHAPPRDLYVPGVVTVP